MHYNLALLFALGLLLLVALGTHGPVALLAIATRYVLVVAQVHVEPALGEVLLAGFTDHFFSFLSSLRGECMNIHHGTTVGVGSMGLAGGAAGRIGAGLGVDMGAGLAGAGAGAALAGTTATTERIRALII